MKQKKSIVGIVVWLIFTIVVVGMAGRSLYTIMNGIVTDNWMTEGAIFAGILLAIVLILITARLITGKFQNRKKVSLPKCRVADVLCVVLLFALAIGVRVYYISQLDVTKLQSTYFQMAAVEAAKSVQDAGNHMTLIYVNILSFLLALFGNKEWICLCLQAVLQCLTLLFLYMAVRIISGKVTAAIVQIAMLCCIPYLYSMQEMEPENLLLCLFAVVLWMCSLLWRHIYKNEKTLVFDSIVFFLAGAATAAIAYIDIIGFLLMLTALIGFFVSVPKGHKKKQPWLQTLMFIIGAAGGILALLMTESYVCGETLQQAVMNYVNPFIDTFGVYEVLLFPVSQIMVSFSILFLSAIWCIWYWKVPYDENISYIIILLGTMGIQLFFDRVVNYQLILSAAWAMVVAASIKAVCNHYKKDTSEASLADSGEPLAGTEEPLAGTEEEVAELIEEQEAAEELEEAEGPEIVEKLEVAEEPKELKKPEESAKAEEPERLEEAVKIEEDKEPEKHEEPVKLEEYKELEKSGESAKTEEVKELEESVKIQECKAPEESVKTEEPKALEKSAQPKESREKEMPKVELIPNPLPLPKQHERKTMDYAFIPKEEEMHYDIEISEDDDYEVK